MKYLNNLFYIKINLVVIFLSLTGCIPLNNKSDLQSEQAKLYGDYYAYAAGKASETQPNLKGLYEAEQSLIQTEQIRDADEMGYLANLRQKQVDAAVALQEAEQALQHAENLKDANDMKHLAYLAKRQSEIAMRIAERKIMRAERETMIEKQVEFLKELNKLEDQTVEEEAAAIRSALISEQQKSRQLQNQLVELESTQTERGLVLSFGNVLFETGEANLPKDTIHNIDKVAEFLEQNPQKKVLIECHTDDRGSDTYNLNLSQQRANSIKRLLLDRNIASNRIFAKGHGESQPIATNETELGRQANRRSEIIILK